MAFFLVLFIALFEAEFESLDVALEVVFIVFVFDRDILFVG